MDNLATETTLKNQLKNRRRLAWVGLLILTLIILSSVIIPVGLIMPFKPQSQGGLSLAFTLRRWSPWLTLIGAGLAIAMVVWLWRGTRWWRKPALVIASS
jgi:hypothetical protein